MKRKLVDEQGRIFGVVSVIDILVVLIAVVLCFAVYTRFFLKAETSVSATSQDKFTYEMLVPAVREGTRDSFRIGDKVYDSENGTLLGVITDISFKAATKETRLSDGTYVLGSVQDRFDVMLTVEADGMISDGRYYASKTYEINANSTLEFCTKYCTATGSIWSID